MRMAGASYAEIAAAGGGILSSVRCGARRCRTRSLVMQARRTLDGFIRHGTTTIEAKSGYGLDEAGELQNTRASCKR